MEKELFIESVRLKGERWKEVAGSNGSYYVSSYGRVISFRRTEPKLLAIVKLKDRGKLYSYVCLFCQKTRVHRLVATAFIPNPQGYEEIDHVNGDGTDNRAENLRWCDRKINMNNPETRRRLRINSRHRAEERTFYDRKVARIKDGVIDKIYDSVYSIKEDGFNDTCVYMVCNNIHKTHAGYEWAYIYTDL